jgi:hypothetical protein
MEDRSRRGSRFMTKSVAHSKISIEDMQAAIWNSGYLLEQRAAVELGKADYKAITNRRFIDPDPPHKPRECDVIAYKEVPLYPTGPDAIYPSLVIECKNFYEPTVFFAKKDFKETFEPLQDEVRVSGIPAKIWQGVKYIPFQEYIKCDSFHHYCKPEVPIATQYCTFVVKKGRWEASHNEEHHDTFNDLIKALEFEISEDFRNWFIDERIEREFVDLSYYYPVLIIQGGFYLALVEKNELPILTEYDHIQYSTEVFSHYYQDVISYQIDVISEKYLPSYLSIINHETSIIRKRLQRQKPKLQISMDKIVEDCKALKTKPKSYREYLEFDYYS